MHNGMNDDDSLSDFYGIDSDCVDIHSSDTEKRQNQSEYHRNEKKERKVSSYKNQRNNRNSERRPHEENKRRVHNRNKKTPEYRDQNFSEEKFDKHRVQPQINYAGKNQKYNKTINLSDAEKKFNFSEEGPEKEQKNPKFSKRDVNRLREEAGEGKLLDKDREAAMEARKLMQSINEDSLKILLRNDWDPEAKLKPPPLFEESITHIHYTDTESKDLCFNDEDCIRELRCLKERDKAAGRSDIKYNFLVGGHGVIYEGRGWNVRAGKNPKGNENILGPYDEYKKNTFNIAFIGCFQDFKPPPPMLLAAYHFVNIGKRMRKINTYFTYTPVKKVV